MFSQSKMKYVLSLHQKKFRQKYNKFLAEGTKIIDELLEDDTAEIEFLCATQNWIAARKSQLKNVPYEMVSEAELKKISMLDTPNQVLAIAEKPDYQLDSIILENNLTLYLDNLQDPGNMGTIVRIADWFGIKNLCCSPNCVDFFHPKVIQATMGSFLRVSHCVANLGEISKKHPKIPIFGAVMDADFVVFDLSAAEKSAGIIVIGNEGSGISEENLALLTHKISIPRAADGGAESLNAAVATGIICAAFRNL